MSNPLSIITHWNDKHNEVSADKNHIFVQEHRTNTRLRNYSENIHSICLNQNCQKTKFLTKRNSHHNDANKTFVTLPKHSLMITYCTSILLKLIRSYIHNLSYLRPVRSHYIIYFPDLIHLWKEREQKGPTTISKYACAVQGNTGFYVWKRRERCWVIMQEPVHLLLQELKDACLPWERVKRFSKYPI